MRIEVIGDCTLALCDAADFMRDAPSFDALVTDPPYGLGERSGTISKLRNRNAYASHDDTREAVADSVVPVIRESLARCGRGVVTPGGKCAWLYPEPVDIGMLYQPATCSLTHWGKATCQPVLFYGKDPLAGKRIQAIHFQNTGKPEECAHPCPKPIAVARWMVSRASLPGECVFDPFMGSGTTGVACVELGRAFVGVEIDPAYFEIACERIDRAQRQARLFA